MRCVKRLMASLLVRDSTYQPILEPIWTPKHEREHRQEPFRCGITWDTLPASVVRRLHEEGRPLYAPACLDSANMHRKAEKHLMSMQAYNDYRRVNPFKVRRLRCSGCASPLKTRPLQRSDLKRDIRHRIDQNLSSDQELKIQKEYI